MKIGLFGGTFDPVHTAHLTMAKIAQQQLGLDSVWFIPVYLPPHKERLALTSSEHRVNMLELAIQDEPTFSVNPLELLRERVSYTYETIQELRKQYPTAEFYFLLGADNVEILAKWKKIDYLVQEVTFVAFARPNHQVKSEYPLRVLPMKAHDVSSTAIRQFQQYSQLHPQVMNYMLKHRLYGLTAIHELVYQKMTYQRFIHTMGVVETADRLAQRYELNRQQCHVAALLHDYAKAVPKSVLHTYMQDYFPEQPFIGPVAHAFVGSILIQQELCITDPVVIEAVCYHTTGHPQMTAVAKCIFLADYIEPNRHFPGVEQARAQAEKSLDAGVYYAIKETNAFLAAQGKLIHPESLALEDDLSTKKEN